MAYKNEQSKIWESYQPPVINENCGECAEDHDEDMEEIAVVEMDPIAPVQPEVELDVAPQPVAAGLTENEVLMSELKKLNEYSQRLYDMAQTVDFDDWMVAKIVLASDYVSDIAHRMDSKADFANTGFEQA